MYKDKGATEIVNKAVDYIYNFQTDKADSIYKTLGPKFASNPGTIIFSAILDYYRLFPIQSNTKEYRSYKARLQKGAEIAEKRLKIDPYDFECHYFSLMVYSLLGRHSAEEDQSMEAVMWSRKSYGYLRSGMQKKESYPEFYLSTGLYNYYRVRYPEDHPIYKPFLIFFPEGDKAQGLIDLDIATKKATYSRVEAFTYLIYICLYYENQPVKALEYSYDLQSRFPANPLIRILHTQALMYNGKFAEAYGHIKWLAKWKNPYVVAATKMLQGWYSERSLKDLPEAKENYLKAMEGFKAFNRMADGMRSLSLSGLARIAAAEGDKVKAKKYYHKVLDITSINILREEAKRYLSKN